MKNWYSAGALILLAVLFLALTMLSGAALKGVRVDLTENRLYTLSQGTTNLLRSIEEPVTLEFFFSEEASSDLPLVRNFARRVHELLEEMAQQSDGNLRVQRTNPRPFSEDEDQAERYGLEAIPVGPGGEELYLGLVGTNMVDGLEVLPFISPAREAFLEYELARMIHVLSRPTRPRVGLFSGLAIEGEFDRQTGQPAQPWAIYDQIGQMFEVEHIEAGAGALPDNIEALVLIHPHELDEDMLFAVDQFVLGGGRLLAFVDPYAETDTGPEANDPMQAMTAERHSTLEPLFETWGLEFSTEEFVGDLGQALQVSLQQGMPPVRHPGIIGVTRSNMNPDDVTTGELQAINLASAGALSLSRDSELTFEPLLSSSAQAGLLSAERLRFLTDPSDLAAELAPTGTEFVLAARLNGRVDSAFPDRDGLRTGDINVIVVADADLLADRYWVQRQRFFGTTILEPFANNGDFVINAIDNLLGNADLISVRSRATSNRPFDLVDDLRREAEFNLRATEQRLEAELAETERRLSDLQQARGDGDLTVLTAEQEAEIDRFITQRLEIRQRLRQVRRELDQDIEALGARIKAVNIALMPILVTLFALGLAWRRRRDQTPHGGASS
ncbi:MAG: Gldg family protein [Wenzhouxiangella sp.]